MGPYRQSEQVDLVCYCEPPSVKHLRPFSALHWVFGGGGVGGGDTPNLGGVGGGKQRQLQSTQPRSSSPGLQAPEVAALKPRTLA